MYVHTRLISSRNLLSYRIARQSLMYRMAAVSILLRAIAAKRTAAEQLQ